MTPYSSKSVLVSLGITLNFIDSWLKSFVTNLSASNNNVLWINESSVEKRYFYRSWTQNRLLQTENTTVLDRYRNRIVH